MNVSPWSLLYSPNTPPRLTIIVDPWFNFRATKYLVKHGFYSFWDWFDDSTSSSCCLTKARSADVGSRNLASPGSSHRGHIIPRPHGYQWRHLPLAPTPLYPGRYKEHMCAISTRVFRTDSLRHVPPDFRNVSLLICWSPRSSFHGHCPWVHLTISCRKL